MAQLRGVDVLNINELANSLKPVVLPGETMKVFILKEGKEYNQGVAYLDDGTMVVVDNARSMIGKTIDVVVTSVLQTTAGKMIFGRFIDANAQPTPIDREGGRRARNKQLSNLRPFDWWRTVFFLIPAISVYTIVLGTLSILSTFVDRRGHAAHWCARAWSWLILATTGVDVQRQSGSSALSRGETYVFISNHQSIYDIPVIFASLPFQLRIIAKESLGRVSVSRLASDARRASAGRSQQSRSCRHPAPLAAARRERISLIIFPEGTRSADGRVGRFKAGSFLLALEAGLTIVPLSISGSRFVMNKGRLTTRPGHVTLTIYDPVPVQRIESPTTADARELASRVESVVRGAG